jgi:hypothetical protein
MNWKPTNGKKPDLPDNQMVQVIDNRGITYEIRVGAMDDTEAFYRESPVLMMTTTSPLSLTTSVQRVCVIRIG